MRDATSHSRQLQLALKMVAILCGCLLLIASAFSNSAALSLGGLSNFIASQLQSTSQLQWLFGIVFLSVGIFFIPTNASKPRPFVGDKDLRNDSYVLYLVDKYQIEKNAVLDQHIACNKIFSSIHDALAYVHLMECPIITTLASTKPLSANESTASVGDNLPPATEGAPSEVEVGVLRNPFLNTEQAPVQIVIQPWEEAKRLKVIGISGVILFAVVLGGLYYANSHSVRNAPKPVVPLAPAIVSPEAPNSDQVASGSIPNQEMTGASDLKEPSKILASTPINERWIGAWIADGVKLKLLVTANLLKLNDEEFTWTGTRPKGVVQCCLAFYEGSVTKSDLLARISGAQEPGAVLKSEAQKTLSLVNGLSDGNFKRIVLADPYLKKYFFIYDQNYVYRISRDLGDKVDVVIEQFKKQE